MNPIIPLYAVFAPFFVWPIELFLPYPYVVEEVVKAYIVSISTGKVRVSSFKTFVTAGVLFALSETVLYTFNVNLIGTSSLFFKRLLVTSLLHSTTFLILFFSFLKGKKIFALGLVTSILFHFLFNLLLGKV